MAKVSNIPIVDSDAKALHIQVAKLLAPTVGRHDRIVRVKREPSRFTTLCPAEVLSLLFEGGEELRVFLKHCGSEQRTNPDKLRTDREVRVYEDLLRGLDELLPVARCYGSRFN